jgi:glycosyltransferase involved in cell wall biosynthesis
MSGTSPAVSVVIPTYNRPALLREALASVRAQTFTDYEVLVVVNGPETALTRSACAIVEEAGYLPLRIERAGIAVALNAGIKAARGEWIAFLDDDDLWEPGKLDVSLAAATAEGADVVFCDRRFFDERGEWEASPVRPPAGRPVREAMTLDNCGGGCSDTMVRRTALIDVGGFDETLSSPDWDLWIRLSWRYRLVWVGQTLVRLRLHPENSSKSMSWFRSTLRIHRKSFMTLPDDLKHLRPRILFEMLRVTIKAAERAIRLKVRDPLRDRLSGRAARSL